MAQDITPYEVREYQRAVNDWLHNHKLHDLLPHLSVDSKLGSQSKNVGLRAAWYFGVGHGWISNSIKGFTRAEALSLTKWFRHPVKFYIFHPFAHRVGLKRIAAERIKRRPHPSVGVVRFDNIPMAGWIADILNAARRDGVYFRVSSGYRSYHDQWVIYQNESGNGYPVAPPGSSHHQGINYPDGAVDIYEGQSNFNSWLRRTGKGRGLEYAGSKDAVHFSIPGPHRDGEGSY